MILPFLVADVVHARARLLTGVTQAVAGRAFLAAVEVTMDPHWHIYWKNPGDSGIPTTVAWGAPKGWKVEPLEYPAPQRFVPGGVAAYGYEKKVLLLARVTPSSQPGALTAKAKWLVCKDACIPGGADLKAGVRVGRTVRVTSQASLLSSVQRNLPVPMGSDGVRAWIGRKFVTLSITPAGLPANGGVALFYPFESGVIDHGKKAVATLSNGPFVFKMDVSPFPESRTRLKGLIVEIPKGAVWPNGITSWIIDARLEHGEPK